MGIRNRRRPTRTQAVLFGFVALLLLASNAVAVLLEGRPATATYWVLTAMNLGLLGMSVWAYRRAPQTPRKPE
jgi:hypothetical protein